MKRQFKELRDLAKLQQVDVAKILNVEQSTVSMWENGNSLPRADMLPKIAALYNCTVDELLKDVSA